MVAERIDPKFSTSVVHYSEFSILPTHPFFADYTSPWPPLITVWLSRVLMQLNIKMCGILSNLEKLFYPEENSVFKKKKHLLINVKARYLLIDTMLFDLGYLRLQHPSEKKESPI